MKKVFILAYSKVNLGDDLFIDILVNRYKNIEFYTRAIKENSYIFNKNENLYYRNYRLDDLLNISADEFDAIVYIGGSIFMEHAGGIERIKKLNAVALKCKENSIPFFFISSNFGPYSSQEYKEETKNLMSNITDICFRDKYSYEEFGNIETVRYAPDVVLSYQLPYKKEDNTVGISVINFKYRDQLKPYEKKYYEVIRNSIINYIKAGKKVTLFSFCEYEGDEETIDMLLKELPQECLGSINVEKYRGNIDEFIQSYASKEYFICSRFHAMILSAVFGQKVAIVSYSDKINNVIKDLSLCEKCINIKGINIINNIELQDFEKLKMNKDTKRQAIKQFEAFERFLKK